MKSWRWILPIAAFVIIGLALVYFYVLPKQEPTADPVEPTTPQMAAQLDLLEKSETLPQYYYQNGFPRYVVVSIDGVGSTPVEMAENYLDTYRDLYFQTDPDLELSVRQTFSLDGMDVVKFYQTYRGIEVLGGEIVVHLHDGQVSGTVGPLLPAPITVDTIPVYTYREAEQIARNNEERPEQEILGQTELMLYDPSLFGRVDSALALVWRVTLSGNPTTRVYVDAHTGEVLLTHQLGEGYYSLDLRDAQGQNSESTNCYWLSEEVEIAEEGNFFNQDYANGQVPDAENAFWFAAEIYSHFVVSHQWESYDNQGGQIEVYINASLGEDTLAAWTPGFLDCDLIEFQTGCVTLDIFTHEFTHGIVEYTSQLVPTGESAPLEESLSDIMGVVIDEEDWIMAEDSDPATCPGHNMDTFAGTSIVHMSQYDESKGEYHNLKIHNHVVYMIGTAGEGAWNGGLTKAQIGQMYFYVITAVGSSGGFADARGAAIHYAASNLGEHAVCVVANAYGTAGIGSMSNDTDCDGFEDDTSWDSDMVPFEDDNCPYGYNPEQYDSDGDGLGDACDDDDDNDGILDDVDNCQYTKNPSQEDSDDDGKGDHCEDSDYDGILDLFDNCILAPNDLQIDQDGDGIGDACDPDLDGDGVNQTDRNGDPLDNCPFIHNPDQANSDGDWIGDACDLCPDAADSEIGQAWTNNSTPGVDFNPQPYQQDSDGDGVPDLCDEDDGARYSAPEIQPQAGPIELELIGIPGGFLQIPLIPCLPDVGGAHPVNTHAVLSFSSIPEGVMFTLGDDGGVPAGKLMLRDGLPAINFVPVGGRSYFLGVLFSPQYQAGSLGELELVYTCNVPDEAGEPGEEPEPEPTPTLTPTSPPETSRCDLFDPEVMSVTILDLPPDASRLTLYVNNPNGFPNFDFDVPGDTEEWVYTAFLGSVEANFCMHQGYFGRMYCEFPLPETMWNTTQILTLQVNYCEVDIFTHERLSIIVPEEEEEESTCSTELDRADCQAAGGTWDCSYDCTCVCP